MLFRRKQPKEATTENPFLNAKRQWNAREYDVLSSRMLWQIMGIVSLLVTLCAVGGIIYIGQQSKFIPYVVEVDKLGQAVTVMPVDKARPVDTRIIHATIASWISDARMVTPDITVQRAAIFRLYAHLPSEAPATTKMHEFLQSKASNPFYRAAKETVYVSITSVIPQSNETWQVDWIEETRDRSGTLKAKSRMRALITVKIQADASNDEEQIRRNPLGILIHDFNWSKQV